MTAQHTPGPWHTRKNDASITAEAPNGTASTVAHVDFSKSRDEWVANARLIAAAPDLLAAAEARIEAARLQVEFHAQPPGSPGKAAVWEPAVQAAMKAHDMTVAAIAKARGES